MTNKVLYPLVIVLAMSNCALTQDNSKLPENYVCMRPIDDLVIDGKLEEKSWKKAEWTDKFVDIEGNKKPKPLYDTQVKMLWDNEYFYIGARLFEPHIWATYTQRDAVIFHENDFEVFIDPNGDTHNYYELEINALGTIWDLLLSKPYRDNGRAINGWDISGLKKGIYIDGSINDPSDIDNFWTIELAIPWNILKETAQRIPEDNDQWRVNFSRVNWQMDTSTSAFAKAKDPSTNKTFPEFNWVWSQQGVIAMHQPETWGIVQFSNQSVGSKKVKFMGLGEYETQLFLRNVYSAQKVYFESNATFTNTISELDLGPIGADIKLESLTLEVTNSQFEATYQTANQTTWHIVQDGRIWKTKAD